MDVVLLSRCGCHLCEQAQDLLICHCPGARTIDVDTSAELTARYGLRVPVLQINGKDVLEGRIDEAVLVRALARERGEAAP